MKREYVCCPSHCCIYHGCKYGYEECPVATGKVRQQSTCEDCGLYDKIESVDEAIARSKGAPSREFLQELLERARKYGWYGDYVEVSRFVETLYQEAAIPISSSDLEPEEFSE